MAPDQPKMSSETNLKANEDALEDFSSRLDDAIESRDQETAPKGKRPDDAINLAFRLVSELIAALLVGGLLGYGLDVLFKTSPIFILCGLALGLAAAFLSVLRMMKTLNNKEIQNSSPNNADSNSTNSIVSQESNQ